LFDIAKAEREAKIESDAMADDLGRKAMTMVARDESPHGRSMPHEQLDDIFRS
jgi:hypothetical protein